MAQNNGGSWPLLTDKSGEEIGSDVVLDESRFLSFRVTENPATGVRYVQMRLWAKNNGGEYRQVFGDQGLTLGGELAQLYAGNAQQIADAIAELIEIVMQGENPASPKSGTSPRFGPRTKPAEEPVAAAAAKKVVVPAKRF